MQSNEDLKVSRPKIWLRTMQALMFCITQSFLVLGLIEPLGYRFDDLSPLLSEGKIGKGYRESLETWNLVAFNAFVELLFLR